MSSPQPTALLAVDVDGTLVNSTHVVAPETKTAIEELHRRDVVIVIASSRSPQGIRFAADHLDLPGLWICGYQGAIVANPGLKWTSEAVQSNEIDAATADAVCTQAVAAGISVGRHFNNRWCVDAITSGVEREASITGENPIVAEDIGSLGTPAHKLQFISEPSAPGPLHSIRDALPSSVSGVFSHANYLEVTSTSAEKATGIALIAAGFGISEDRTAAIGDGENDLGMIAGVGFGVAMGNATKTLKSEAEAVVADNDHGGVAEAISLIARHWDLPATPPASL